MIELYTDRLKLRTLRDTDWQDFLAIHLSTEVNQYVREPETLDDIKAKFEQRSLPWFYESGDWLTLVIEELQTGKFVGFTGLHCDDLVSERAEVGYLLAVDAQGKGYGTESLRAVIDWACIRYSIHKFVGQCAKANVGSARVMEKCGFKLEGLLKQHIKINGVWHDDCVYGLLTSERKLPD